MIHHLQHIVDLVEIFQLKGIRQVVVSPGSRNAPLINLFANNRNFTLHSIVDERSAAFYGLGIALATREPVILLCTSGTAALNYSPALAEAFYQHVPLIALTADRPEELIDQQDNQTIHQQDIYKNFIKDSLAIKLPIHNEEDLIALHHQIDALLNRLKKGQAGPIHINVPIAEPLYVPVPSPSAINIAAVGEMVYSIEDRLVKDWQHSGKKMILCGQLPPDKELNAILNSLASLCDLVVLAEPITNIKGEHIIPTIDRVMMLVEDLPLETFKPDILISVGGPVVSKRLKLWLQKQPALKHYRLSETDNYIDTYHNLTELIIGKPAHLLKILLENYSTGEKDYQSAWGNLFIESSIRHNRFLSQAPYSDVRVFYEIMNCLPDGSVLHFGNSNPVRYAQLFNTDRSSEAYSNRGVSGIDGCLSTAVGFASQSEKLNIILLGDLSFLYDSNALWNRNLPSNLRIVVINNQGGGIFRLITNPDKQNRFEEFIEAYHPVNIEKLAEAYGVSYFRSEGLSELQGLLDTFFNENRGTSLLEIITPREENPIVYAGYVSYLKNKNK